MAHPVYVLLPPGTEWSAIPEGASQPSRPVSWYLRQLMPAAATQTVVLVDGDSVELPGKLARVARRAVELGGIAIDAATQDPVKSAVAPLRR